MIKFTLLKIIIKYKKYVMIINDKYNGFMCEYIKKF